ncbi:hypothetical protein ABN028_25090 [Actinopolymorpha sp. B17G11]|uniref:hypothetical protein n=1 Tax=Actinopolymorpha sp. B17G11 TaxID=3160861 RepID=UPI0032E4F18F
MNPTIQMSAWQRLLPFFLAVPFTTIVTGLFNLAEVLPAPVALLAGAAWGAGLGLFVTWFRARRPGPTNALEDGFVYLGTAAFAFAGCGGLMAILLLNGALDSPSITGQTLGSTFLPSIPYYVVVNSLLEVLLIPGVLYLGWRPGKRRALLVTGAVMYFAMRVWTYLAFVPARLGWAETEHTTQSLTTAERQQAASDLMLNDPRWIPILAMFALFLFAAHLPASSRCELRG